MVRKFKFEKARRKQSPQAPTTDTPIAQGECHRTDLIVVGKDDLLDLECAQALTLGAMSLDGIDDEAG